LTFTTPAFRGVLKCIPSLLPKNFATCSVICADHICAERGLRVCLCVVVGVVNCVGGSTVTNSSLKFRNRAARRSVGNRRCWVPLLSCGENPPPIYAHSPAHALSDTFSTFVLQAGPCVGLPCWSTFGDDPFGAWSRVKSTCDEFALRGNPQQHQQQNLTGDACDPTRG
jgi:hypothetical protein